MNRIAPKIAIEIGVLLENDHRDTGSREQIASHHSRGPATDDHATRLQFFNHGCHG
jgi:hypothetical protein